jgi:hypothetical protein
MPVLISVFVYGLILSYVIQVLWLENLKGTDHSEDLGIDGRIILE